MNSKSIIVFICALIFANYISAQTYIQGGINLANISAYSNGKSEKNNTLTTFNAGLLSRLGLSKLLDLESGLILSGHGSKAETYFTDNDFVKTTFNPLYLEVPLNVVIKFPLPGKKNLFIHAGPYAAMGIGGKSKSESHIAGVFSTAKHDIKFSNADPFTSNRDDASYDKLKRFDFGLNFGGGLDLSKIILKVNYGLGITKINSTQRNNGVDDENKCRTLSISVGIPLKK